MFLPRITACALFLAAGSLCATAFPQSTALEIAQSSNGARTPSKATASAAQSHPDIFSPDYVPPKPKPRAYDVPPKLVYSVEARFPADAPKGKFSGVAVVATLVGTDGKPEQVHVVKSLGPEFDKAAVAAVQQYRFRPAMQKGKLVPVTVDIEVQFRRY